MLPRDSSASDTLYNLFFLKRGRGIHLFVQLKSMSHSFIDSCDTLVFTLQVDCVSII